MQHTILITEDEPRIRKLLTISLECEGYQVLAAENGKQGIDLMAQQAPALLLLDLGLPDMDGKEVIARVREWSMVPIVVCSARNDDTEMIAAFELGADDYVTKPFNPDVLLARIRACLRKINSEETGMPELVNGPIRMDLVRHETFIHGEKITLTPKEHELLRYFMNNRGKMLTHRQILNDVWGAEHTNNAQYLRVYVGQLRAKLRSKLDDTEYLMTEPGIGYRMDSLNESAS